MIITLSFGYRSFAKMLNTVEWTVIFYARETQRDRERERERQRKKAAKGKIWTAKAKAIKQHPFSYYTINNVEKTWDCFRGAAMQTARVRKTERARKKNTRESFLLWNGIVWAVRSLSFAYVRISTISIAIRLRFGGILFGENLYTCIMYSKMLMVTSIPNRSPRYLHFTRIWTFLR